MSLKSLSTAFTTAASISVEALPTVITNSVEVVTTVLHTVNGAAKYASNEMDEILQDQLALKELKDDYRTIVKTEAKAAIVSGDKESIVAAYKTMQNAFEAM